MRRRSRIFSAAFTLFAALTAFVCFIKPAILIRIFWENAVVSGAAASELWPSRLLITLPLTAFWVFVLSKLGKPSALFSLVGLGSFLVLAASAIGLEFGSATTLIFLAGPFWIHAAVGLFRASDVSALVATPAEQGTARLVIVAILALFSLQLMNDVVFDVFFRGAASGDEMEFWWSSFRKLHEAGFSRYMREFAASSYVPGYPVLACFLSAFIPGSWMGFADAAIPLIFGFLLFWTTAAGARRQRPSAGEAAFLATVFALLFFSDSWIRTMVMRSWYGEAMAVLVCAMVLLELSADTDDKCTFENLLLVFGLGFFARISKAPLASILLPAVVPCFILTAFLFPPSVRNARLRRTVALAAGAVAAQLLWAQTLHVLAKPDYYKFAIGSLLQPDFINVKTKLVPFVWAYYKKQFLVPYVLVTILAFALEPRKHLAAFLSSGALIASVFVLYSTFWTHTEHESAVRYLMHGIYAWIVYIVAMHYPLFTRLILNCVRVPFRGPKEGRAA